MASAVDRAAAAEFPNVTASSSLEVRELTAELYPAWQAYVGVAPAATVFHELQWMRAVQKAYGHEPRYYVLRGADGAVRGMLPLFQVKGPLTGRALISIPYAVYGGIVADDAGGENLLAETARGLVSATRSRYLELRQEATLEGGKRQCHYYTFRTRMPKDPAEVLGRYPRKARAAIRHARAKFGLQSRFGHDLLQSFHTLYLRSLRRLGSPPHGHRFLRALVEEFGERCLVQMVYQGEQPVAGVLSFSFRNQILPYYAAIDERFSRLNTSNFMYYTLMEQAVKLGLEVYDFGRTRMDNETGCQFKINQGFEPEPLTYTFYTADGSEPPNLRPSNPRFSWPRAVWQRLPLSVTSAFGGVLSRWLP